MKNPVGEIWFKCSPMGVNMISKAISRLTNCVADKVDGSCTNSSLRRTAKTRLIENGIPSEVAQRKTGILD
jgi:hypothetical protein